MSSKISLASCAEIPKALASWLAEGLRPWFSSRSAISRSTNWSAPEAIGEQLQASGSLCMRPNSTNFWARHETHECPCLQTMEKNSRGIMPIHGYITPKSRVFHGLCFGCAFALPQGCFPLASHQASKPHEAYTTHARSLTTSLAYTVSKTSFHASGGWKARLCLTYLIASMQPASVCQAHIKQLRVNRNL